MLLDLFLEVFHRLLVGVGGRFQLFLHLLKLFCELLEGFFVELAGLKILGKFVDFFERFVPIALLHGLDRLVGRPGAHVLHFVQLLFERIFAAELFDAALRAAWPNR